MSFYPVYVFKDELAGMNLTIVDLEMENKVFKYLKSPEELNFCKFVNVDLE